MKKVLIGIVVGLLSFAAGGVGLFYLMPTLAPEVAERTQAQIDSTRMAQDPALDSLYHATYAPLVRQDSLRKVAVQDSLRQVAFTQSLQDSLRTITTELQRLEQEKQALKKQLEATVSRIEKIEKKQVEAASFSSTLSKLDDGELSQVLASMDLPALQLLYTQASARNQAKMLQAMAPDRAARVVQTLMGMPPPATPPPATASADTPGSSE